MVECAGLVILETEFSVHQRYRTRSSTYNLPNLFLLLWLAFSGDLPMFIELLVLLLSQPIANACLLGTFFLGSGKRRGNYFLMLFKKYKPGRGWTQWLGGMKSSDGRWGAQQLCVAPLRDHAVRLRVVLVGTGQGREKTKPFLIPTCLSSSQTSLLGMLKSPRHHANVEKFSVKWQRLLHMSNKHYKDI